MRPCPHGGLKEDRRCDCRRYSGGLCPPRGPDAPWRASASYHGRPRGVKRRAIAANASASSQLFRLDVMTINPTPAMTAVAPSSGGMATRSRCLTEALNGPSSTVSRRRVYENPPTTSAMRPAAMRMNPRMRMSPSECDDVVHPTHRATFRPRPDVPRNRGYCRRDPRRRSPSCPMESPSAAW